MNILKAAAEAFVRGGYESTSVDDLVRALKVHPGRLYTAFGSKHGLFLAVLRHYIRADRPDAINRSCPSGGTGVSALLDSGNLDLLLVAALDRGPVDAQLAVHVHGLDKLWALRSQLTIPLSHVRGATVDPGIAHEPKGLRGPGAHVPDRAKVIVIELDDDTYQRLVIEVPDPRAAVDYIERAIAQH